MSETYPHCCWQENGRCHSPLLPAGREEVSEELCRACPVRHHGDDVGSLRAALAILHPPRVTECIHLGKVLDRLGCGCVKRWVRACEVHGKCTLAEPTEGLPTCSRCPDYQADR